MEMLGQVAHHERPEHWYNINEEIGMLASQSKDRLATTIAKPGFSSCSEQQRHKWRWRRTLQGDSRGLGRLEHTQNSRARRGGWHLSTKTRTRTHRKHIEIKRNGRNKI
jgi:hypothetical protein